MIHQPCEVSLHLYSSDIFIHPPPPKSELPGDDKTLRGLVEIKVPTDRTIQALKVSLNGHQTLAIPQRQSAESSLVVTRYEEKTLLDKVVEITSDGRSVTKGKGKGKEAPPDDQTKADHGLFLEKGVHG